MSQKKREKVEPKKKLPAKGVADDQEFCESVRAEQRGEPGGGEHRGHRPGRCCDQNVHAAMESRKEIIMFSSHLACMFGWDG